MISTVLPTPACSICSHVNNTTPPNNICLRQAAGTVAADPRPAGHCLMLHTDQPTHSAGWQQQRGSHFMHNRTKLQHHGSCLTLLCPAHKPACRQSTSCCCYNVHSALQPTPQRVAASCGLSTPLSHLHHQTDQSCHHAGREPAGPPPAATAGRRHETTSRCLANASACSVCTMCCTILCTQAGPHTTAQVSNLL